MTLYETLFQAAAVNARNGEEEDARECFDRYIGKLSSLTPGDRLYFGKYHVPGGMKPQDVKATCPICWRVLDADAESVLVISENILDWEGFFVDGKALKDETDPSGPWKASYLRQMLRRDYTDDWFNGPELALIADSEIVTSRNPAYPDAYAAEGGAAVDKLFPLSVEEVLRYFGDGTFDESRVEEDRYGEKYYPLDGDAARAHIVYFEKDYDNVGDFEIDFETHPWWLRTPGGSDEDSYGIQLCAVTGGGDLYLYGYEDGADELGIRPAMRLDLTAGYEKTFRLAE